ncbi:bestrophin family protein [Phaeocystidibacter luteus]|uniref:Bestrophin n=1 Tax=Phaeocystidibacter luteus TaxID=911197 RepID=A0A6N6RHV8_9FLAO|nr:bestrophin family protein [Phaeocystidibacter luteus]KAB2809924.1 bestrophin [Phaeocystidibacter luteus]
MIIYTPNQHWFKDIGHLARSWTMIKVMRAVLMIGAYTLVVTLVHNYIYEWSLREVSGLFSLLGIVLSILLVFRTNSAYDRWWEGRKQWGALVNNCRNLAIYCDVHLPQNDKMTKMIIARDIGNFCLAFVEHLRSGTVVEELKGLSDEEIALYKSKSHVPNHISKQIYQTIHDAYKDGRITGEDLRNSHLMHKALLDILGACERIKKTPIPFSYNVYLKVFITAYGLLLPFAMLTTLGFWTIPAVMFVFFAFIGVEMMGEEIEDPFGLDCNDLPTGLIANTIRENVLHLMDVPHEHWEKVPEKPYEKVF